MLPMVTDMFIQCKNVRSLAARRHSLTTGQRLQKVFYNHMGSARGCNGTCVRRRGRACARPNVATTQKSGKSNSRLRRSLQRDWVPRSLQHLGQPGPWRGFLPHDSERQSN